MSTIVKHKKTQDILLISWDQDLEEIPNNLGFDPKELTMEDINREEFLYKGRMFKPPVDEVFLKNPTLEERFESFLTRVEAIPENATAAQVRDEVREAAKSSRRPE